MHAWNQLRASFAAARPIDAIIILSGTGLLGSVYRKTIPDDGEWYLDGVATGVTTQDLPITLAREGKATDFRTPGGFISNVIHMFVPSDLDNLLLWNDAYSPSDFVLQGGTGPGVLALASRVGAINWQQGSASLQPTYSPTGRNSKPAFSMTGGQQMFTTSFASFPDNAEPSSVIALAFANASAANYRALLGWGTGNTTGNYRIVGKASTNNRPLVLAEAETRDDTVAWLNSDAVIFGAHLPTRQDIAFNGGTLFTGAITLNTGANGYANLGKGRNDDPRGWEGSFHELLAFGDEITTNERQKLEGYLCHRWGYTSLLPSGHPYKSAAPRA